MASRTVEVKILADASKLEKGFARAEQRSSKFGQRMGKSGANLKKFGMVAAGAGVAVGGALVLGLKSSVEAAMEAEKSQANLRSALKNVGSDTPKVRGQIDTMVSSLTNLGGWDDEDLQDAFADLTRTTGDAGKAMQSMGLVSDLARAKNISLSQAAKIVGRVQNGNTGILKRYGIELRKGATAHDALAAMQKKFGGAAKAYGDTTAGQIDKAKVAFGNLKESIGAQLLPAIGAGAQKMAELLNKYGPIVAEKLGAAIKWVKAHWPEIKQKISEVMEALEPIIRPVLDNIKQVFGLFQAVLNGDWSKAWQRVKNILKNSLTALWNYMKLIYPKMGAAALAIGRAIHEKFKELLPKLLPALRSALEAVWNKVKEYAPKVGAAALEIGKQLFNKIREKAAEVPGKVGALLDQVPGVIRGAAGAIGSAALSIGSTVASHILSGIGDIGGRIASKIRDGVNSILGRVNSLSIPGLDLRTPSFTIPTPGPIPDISVPSVGVRAGPWDLPNLPYLAQGGIVRRPTLAMIGEAGPEAVVPLSRGRGGVGGVTVIVNVQGSVTSERDLAESIRRQLVRYGQRNLTTGIV